MKGDGAPLLVSKSAARASDAVEGVMRVQLQQQSGGRTIHHAAFVLRAPGGVYVDQLLASLRLLRESDVIPAREEAGAKLAFGSSVRWIKARPPAGVSGRFSKSF